MNPTRESDRPLLALLLAFTVASLIHFAHNATYLDEYPNMPKWLTAAGVWWAWVLQVCVGVIGYAVLRVRSQLAGLAILAIYAAFGFGGLDHYVVAPVSAHSIAMNATIALEALAGLALLIYIVHEIVRDRTRRGHAHR